MLNLFENLFRPLPQQYGTPSNQPNVSVNTAVDLQRDTLITENDKEVLERYSYVSLWAWLKTER